MEVQLPEKLMPLFEAHRYKVLYGGRGGGKSMGIARALILLGYKRRIRVLCARELMNSIAESVHYILASQIEELGLEDFYTVQNATIIGRNGTEFVFASLKHNVTKIKSYEAVDIVWVEEAQNVSKSSWSTLIPTIRKPGSEIWVSFNPDLETDETYKRFIVNPSEKACVIKMNHSDNPWFPQELRDDMEELRDRDPDEYLHVYEGHCRSNLQGAVYAKELRAATEENRICRVPHNQGQGVHVFFDLGWSDCTSILFVQKAGYEFHFIDSYQNRHEKLSHYLQIMQQKGYVYDKIWLPHDSKKHELISGKTAQQIVEAAGFKVAVIPRLKVEDGINAVRTIFNRCLFDIEKCADAIQAFRHYRYEVNPDTGEYSKKPLHDDHSHYADSLRMFALSTMDAAKKPETKTIQVSPHGRFEPNVGWMGH